MKKVTAIFLLLQILSNNTFAEELLKMPGLITHYFHHAREHKDTSGFFDFLHQHYSDHHKNDRHADKHDEDQDHNLPFKHCGGSCANAHNSVIGFVSIFQNSDYLFPLIKEQRFPIEDDRIENLDIANIWQPPKLF